MYRKELPKKGAGAGTVCRFKGGLGEKEGVVLREEGGLIAQCTLCFIFFVS